VAMLRVSENRRFLVDGDGSPFFYLGDTAWELFHRLSRGEAEQYLQDRASKGFTVIQAVAISEFDGLTVPNANGDLPLIDGDPTRPNDAYFRHVDFVVDRAAELGLHVGLLPTWGDKVGPMLWGTGPEVFTPANAAIYGEFLGARYSDAPIVWIHGGDRVPTEPRHLETWRAMAAGLARGDGGRHLMTFHPRGNATSAAFVHDEPWLDFNMLQSGHHRRDTANDEMIETDYAREPTKPCLDGEPCYEDHPVNWDPTLGWFDDWDARKAAYRALFAGAHGHTYGANSVFQFWDGGDPGKFGARRPWLEALDLPGASQMIHARRLLESRPVLDRVPDQALIGSGGDGARATRDRAGTYGMVYLPSGRSVTVTLGLLAGDSIAASWFDPRTGQVQPIGRCEKVTRRFDPPTSGPGNDWVLVLDDAARGYPPPGGARDLSFARR
jgi:hypothetical protein